MDKITDTHAETHHETRDINVRPVLFFGAGLMLTTAVVGLLVWLLFAYFSNREAASGVREFPLAAEQQNRLPPEPRLQTNPREDLRDLRAREDALLNAYGWADRSTGAVRIPIDEAMKLVVQRGLPARTRERQ